MQNELSNELCRHYDLLFVCIIYMIDVLSNKFSQYTFILTITLIQIDISIKILNDFSVTERNAVTENLSQDSNSKKSYHGTCIANFNVTI